MTSDQVRSFYAALGIELPEWSTREAPVRCFAQPDAHNRADRSPSCSVSLTSGAWNCHGCGAHGGAYDAAVAAGYTARSAMDLLISHGLAEPRISRNHPTRRPPPGGCPAQVTPRHEPPELRWDEAEIAHCVEALDGNSRLVRRLILERAWAPRTMRELELGFDGARITIPIRDQRGQLRGVLRYDPFGRREPKMRAVPGTRLGLVPHPIRERAGHIVLVEGPPDMIAARSCGVTAIAIPGTSAWQTPWAQLLDGKRVTIVMDCDPAGRRAAQEIAASLERTVKGVEIVDLCPGRDDGYDLTDRIIERRRSRSRPSGLCTVASLLRAAKSRSPNAARAHAHEDQEA